MKIAKRFALNLLMTAVVSVVLIACNDHPIRRSIDFPQLAHPEKDAQRAAAHSDYSLRGVYGFVIYLPGIKGDYEILRRKFGIVAISGTSDFSKSESSYSLNRAARAYASKYNQRIFSLLGCDTNAPMNPCKKPAH